MLAVQQVNNNKAMGLPFFTCGDATRRESQEGIACHAKQAKKLLDEKERNHAYLNFINFYHPSIMQFE